MSSVTPTLDGAATLADGTGLPSGQAIQFLTALSIGTHTFSIDNADNVGNRGTRLFLDAGKIKNAGTTKSLLAKLDAGAIMITDAQCLIANCP